MARTTRYRPGLISEGHSVWARGRPLCKVQSCGKGMGQFINNFYQ